MSSQRFSALQLMQALQLGHAVAALHALGVMEELPQPCEPAALAERLGLNAALLSGLLDHAARATDLVQRRGRRYRRTRAWNDDARFLGGLYGLAFGPPAAGVQTLLGDPSRAGRLVDHRRHAQVFDAAAPGADAALVGLLRQVGLRRVLDLGCGPARLLVALAQSDLDFRGWGVEARRPMLARARATVREAGVAAQVRLLKGDARDPSSAVPVAVAASTQAVVASQFVNELFGAGPAAAVAWMRALRGLLPGRWLVVADYAGRLGSPQMASPRTLVHDHAQLLSGQGVPPANRRDWAALYAAAGVRLVHVIEDVSSTRFIHLVAL